MVTVTAPYGKGYFLSTVVGREVVKGTWLEEAMPRGSLCHTHYPALSSKHEIIQQELKTRLRTGEVVGEIFH